MRRGRAWGGPSDGRRGQKDGATPASGNRRPGPGGAGGGAPNGNPTTTRGRGKCAVCGAPGKQCSHGQGQPKQAAWSLRTPPRPRTSGTPKSRPGSRGAPASLTSYVNSRNLAGLRATPIDAKPAWSTSPKSSTRSRVRKRRGDDVAAAPSASMLMSQSTLLNQSYITLGSFGGVNCSTSTFNNSSLTFGQSGTVPHTPIRRKKRRPGSISGGRSVDKLPSAPRIDTGLSPAQLIKSMGGPLRWRPYQPEPDPEHAEVDKAKHLAASYLEEIDHAKEREELDLQREAAIRGTSSRAGSVTGGPPTSKAASSHTSIAEESEQEQRGGTGHIAAALRSAMTDAYGPVSIRRYASVFEHGKPMSISQLKQDKQILPFFNKWSDQLLPEPKPPTPPPSLPSSESDDESPRPQGHDAVEGIVPHTGQQAKEKFFDYFHKMSRVHHDVMHPHSSKSATAMSTRAHKPRHIHHAANAMFGVAPTAKEALETFSSGRRFARECAKQGLVPEPLLVRSKWSAALRLQHYGVGDKFAVAIGRGLRSLPNLEFVDLSNNRFSDKSVWMAVKALSMRAGEVDQKSEKAWRMFGKPRRRHQRRMSVDGGTAGAGSPVHKGSRPHADTLLAEAEARLRPARGSGVGFSVSTAGATPVAQGPTVDTGTSPAASDRGRRRSSLLNHMDKIEQARMLKEAQLKLRDERAMQKALRLAELGPDPATLRSVESSATMFSQTSFALEERASAYDLRVPQQRMPGTMEMLDTAGDDPHVEALLQREGQVKPVTAFNVSGNHVGKLASAELGRWLRVAASLSVLNLSNCNMSDESGRRVIAAAETAAHLKTLDLSHNKLETLSGQALGDYLLVATSLRDLDVSWNNLHGKGALALAHAMGTNAGLRKLKLAHNRFADAAAQALGLELCDNQTLQVLDVSHNRVPGPAAVVLASALTKCFTLHTLILNDNPLGKEGVSAVLRAVRTRSEERDEEGAPKWLSALQPVNVQLFHCRLGANTRKVTEEDKLFNPADPSGLFNLSMAVPYDCIVLDLVTTEASNRAGFMVEKFYYTPPRSQEKLALEFGHTLSRAVTAPELGRHRGLNAKVHNMDATDQARYKQEMGQVMEIREVASGAKWKRPNTGRVVIKIKYRKYPSKWWHAVQAHTFTALMSVLKTCTHDHEDRLTMLNLLSEDIDMNCDQVQQLLDSDIMRESTEGLRVKQMARFLCRVVDSDKVHTLIHKNLNGGGRKSLKKELGPMYRLVVQNPTGHYKLNITVAAERATMQRLCEINEEEKAKRRRMCDNGMGPGDTSQHGGWDNFRNVTLDGARFSLDSRLPRTGTLELDYVSVARPRYDAVAATPGRLRRLLEGLKLVPRGSMRRARQMAMQQRREAMAEEERQRKVKAHQKADDTPAAASPTSFSMRAKLKVGESRASLVKFNRTLVTDARFLSSRQLLKPTVSTQDLEQHALLKSFAHQPKPGMFKPITKVKRAARKIRMVKSFRLMGKGGFGGKGRSKGKGGTFSPKSGGGMFSPKRGARSPSPKSAASGSDDDTTIVSDDEFEGGFVKPEELPRLTLEDSLASQRLARANEEKIKRTAMQVRVQESVDDLTSAACSIYITCEQAIYIVSLYPDWVPGAQMDALAALFGRIIDLHNFLDVIASKLAPEMVQQCIRQFGWLNILNPLKPEREYKLDLAVRDHRVVAEMLVHLAVVEPGENWEDETYNDIQGWELPATWATTVPSEGSLTCTYTSFGPGCRPNWPERRQLCSFVLPDFPEAVQQAAEDDFNALIAELKKKGKAP